MPQGRVAVWTSLLFLVFLRAVQKQAKGCKWPRLPGPGLRDLESMECVSLSLNGQFSSGTDLVPREPPE